MHVVLKTLALLLLSGTAVIANPGLADVPVSYHGLLEQHKGVIVQVENQSPFISRETVLGSGIAISADGYVITSESLVSRMERVTLRYSHDQMPVSAMVVGRDKGIDLALLKVRGDKALPYLKVGPGQTLRVGDRLFFLFRSPQLGMRHGIASSVEGGVIVSDHPLSPDMFGAMVTTDDGKLLGIVSKHLSIKNRYMTLITADYIARSAKALMKEDRTVYGFFGMSLNDLAPSQYGIYGTDRGALITAIEANASAERAGLKKGDLLVSINGSRINGRKAFSESLYEAKAEDNVTIGFVRNRLNKRVTMRLPVVDQSILNPNAFVHRGLVVEAITPAIRSMQGLPPYLKGVYVSLVMPGSLAERRGFRAGDVIIQLGTKTIDGMAAFKEYAGRSARERIFIYRNGWNFIKLLAEEEEKKK